jgi:hypothetical protein
MAHACTSRDSISRVHILYCFVSFAQGYWSQLRNVAAELASWMEAQGAPKGVMPTLRALRESGAHTLELAVTQHGGPGAVAAALGLRPRCGNHATWEALLADMQQVMAVAGTPAGIMPSRRAFIAAGRGDLYRCGWRNAKHVRAPCCVLSCVALLRVRSALVKHGGVAAVARRAGLVYRKARTPADMRVLRRHALTHFCACGVWFVT